MQNKNVCTLQLGLALLPLTMTLSTRMAAHSQRISSQPNATTTPPIPGMFPLSIHTPNELTVNRVSVCPEEPPSPLRPVPETPPQLLCARRLHQHCIHTHTHSTPPVKPLLAAWTVKDFACSSMRGRVREGQLQHDNLTPLTRRRCSGTRQKAKDRGKQVHVHTVTQQTSEM